MKLHYTDEMKEQDRLWTLQKEDLKKMKCLFEDIINEAKQYGFHGVYEIYNSADETIVEVYRSQGEMDKIHLSGENNDFCFGYCKPLIDCLELLIKE